MFTAGKEVNSLVEKAKRMQTEIKDFLQNYKPIKSLPKVGDNIFNYYVDTTKGISEEERDELTSYLCTFKEINLSVLDIPSLVHDTISFVIHHSKDENNVTSLDEYNWSETQEDVVRTPPPTIYDSDTLEQESQSILTSLPPTTLSSSILPLSQTPPIPRLSGINNASVKKINHKRLLPKKKKTVEDLYEIQYKVYEKELLKQDKEIEKLNLQIEILKQFKTNTSVFSSPTVNQLLTSSFLHM